LDEQVEIGYALSVAVMFILFCFYSIFFNVLAAFEIFLFKDRAAHNFFVLP